MTKKEQKRGRAGGWGQGREGGGRGEGGAGGGGPGRGGGRNEDACGKRSRWMSDHDLADFR